MNFVKKRSKHSNWQMNSEGKKVQLLPEFKLTDYPPRIREKMNNSNTKKTIDAYNKNAEKYASKFENFPTYKKKMIAFQRKYIPKGAEILDLGCGPGNNIKTILERDDSCNFTGVDLSVELINIAKQKYPHFEFINQDICKLNISSQYDVILASFCIVHLTNIETQEFIKYISQKLHRNGHLYLSFMEGCESGFETTSFSSEKIFFNYFQVTYVLEILIKYGFNILEISKEEYLEPNETTTTDVFVFASRN